MLEHGFPTLGTVEASVDQNLQQSITGSRTDGSSNNGQTLVLLLSKEGPYLIVRKWIQPVSNANSI